MIKLKLDSSLIQNSSETNSILVTRIDNNEKGVSKKDKIIDHKACGTRHKIRDCKVVCSHCKKTAHNLENCRKKKNDEQKEESPKTDENRKNQVKKNQKSKVSSILINKIISSRKFINLLINEIPIELQVDSGADVTIISHEMSEKLELKISPTTFSPNDASGNSLNLVGEVDCEISFESRTLRSKICVSSNKDLNVFGNDSLEKFNLWDKPFNDFCINHRALQTISKGEDYPEFLRKHFRECLATTLGKCKKFKANLSLK